MIIDNAKAVLTEYNGKEEKTFEDILDFHVKFERIHPFRDGNGRVGRLIMFKECLKYNIVPFIIEDNLKMFYYRGLKEWNNEKEYLTDTCLTAQDKYKAILDFLKKMCYNECLGKIVFGMEEIFTGGTSLWNQCICQFSKRKQESRLLHTSIEDILVVDGDIVRLRGIYFKLPVQ